MGNSFKVSTSDTTVVELSVRVDCAGCETNIKKALLKLPGVDDVHVDMGLQKVTVMGWADRKKVLKTVRKTGKRAELWPYPYNPEYHGYNIHYNYNKPTPSAYYNYYVHGYSNGEDYGYYHKPPYSTILDEKAMATFSDDNPHACSIM